VALRLTGSNWKSVSPFARIPWEVFNLLRRNGRYTVEANGAAVHGDVRWSIVRFGVGELDVKADIYRVTFVAR
jgi:hypothetical protein